MSPSLRESLRIGLCRERIVLARYGRGLRPKLLEKEILPVEPAPAGEPWRGTLALLSKFLHGRTDRFTDASVVLSNQFVRFMLLGPNDKLATRGEWQAYAAHHFEKTYGERALEWDIQVARGRIGQPRLASAVDRTLVEAIAAAFEASPIRLRSVQPYLMTAFNRTLSGEEQSSFWFVLQEPGRLLLGLIRDGVWQSVRSRQENPLWREELRALVERENALIPTGEPCRQVVVSTIDPIGSLVADGYQVSQQTLPLSGEDGHYGMVCA